MNEVALYFHTIRQLRPVQIVNRVWRRLYRPRADQRAAPRGRRLSGRYVAPLAAAPSLIAPDLFRFLNVERRCSTAADWHPPDAAKLWVYNLHYFHDLNAHDSPSRTLWHRQLLERWVRENPPGALESWEPYPVSLRLVNWVKWAARGNVLPAPCHASLAVQARWLASRLEYQILGNHLLANAKALVHAGLYFEGPEADHWYRRGVRIIGRQLREQVLADGGHFELSPMYHALVLEDLLDLINLLRAAGREPPSEWLASVGRMRGWLARMSHPDGDIAFFNDAAFGIAGTPRELEAYALRLHLQPLPEHSAGVAILAASGYVCVDQEPIYLVCDCAAVGPRYQPGHAHADTLSFELSLRGQRVFVNSGVSEYGRQPERQRQRGTAAHNTVVLDGENSSEIWDGFRVARRAPVRLCRADAAGGTITVEAWHDGYRRLPGRNRHMRRWRLTASELRIEDRISGPFSSAQAHFHLHPDVEVRRSAHGEVGLWSRGRELANVSFEQAAAVQIERGTWHPRFGVTAANACISVTFAQSQLTSRIRWAEPR